MNNKDKDYFSDDEYFNNTSFCSGCGAKLSTTDRYCGNCGAKLANEIQKSPTIDQSPIVFDKENNYQRSRGSKLSGFASIIICIAFFLPWVRACNTEVSGYEIAINQGGRIRAEEPWLFWLAFAAPVICFLMFVFIRNYNQKIRRNSALFRLILCAIGFLPLLKLLLNAYDQQGRFEILYGAWIAISGYVLIVFSSLLDLLSKQDSGLFIDSS